WVKTNPTAQDPSRMGDCFKGIAPRRRPPHISARSRSTKNPKFLLPDPLSHTDHLKCLELWKEINTKPCEVCGIVIRYKGDVARHAQLHRASKEVEMFKCSYDGCVYQTLQKSNLKTHVLKHTGEKPHECPECDKRFSDPGCLTRHRKRKHAYVPTRNGGRAQPTIGAKKSRRHTSIETTPSRSPSCELPDDTSLRSYSPAASSTCESPDPYSYTWDKLSPSMEGSSTSMILEPSTPLDFLPTNLSPAIGTCSQLVNGMEQFSQYPHDDYYMSHTYTENPTITLSAELSWIFDMAAPQTIAPLDNFYGGSYPSDFPSSSFASPSSSPESSSSEFPVDLLPPSPVDFDCFGFNDFSLSTGPQFDGLCQTDLQLDLLHSSHLLLDNQLSSTWKDR
ncbi:hypothetical protein H0H93_007425, partial [Arthromyces matolae]